MDRGPVPKSRSTIPRRPKPSTLGRVLSATHGSLAAVACRGTVVLWNRHTGERRETIDLATGADLPTALAWNGDGSQLFVGTARGVILCFDVPRP